MTDATIKHLSLDELEATLDDVRRSPSDAGTIDLIVRRPDVDVRERVEVADLDTQTAMAGDNWLVRGSTSMPDGSANPQAQLTIANTRFIGAIAGDEARRDLAGDQLYVDMDISMDNLPAGTRLRIGTAVVEVSEKPHTGCAKFAARFGADALRFVNSEVGKQLRLRGLNARIVEGGRLRRGDAITKL